MFEGGEKTKTLDTLAEILNFLADNRFTRSDILVALGGGIIGDVTGFAAASYLRGVEFIQIPTTLLATVDSSVGGKTGVNLNTGKNLAGAFWQPSLVMFDPNVLKTLSYDTILDGIAEAVKAGFIADRSITDDVSAHVPAGESFSEQDINFLTQLAAKAVEVKRASSRRRRTRDRPQTAPQFPGTRSLTLSKNAAITASATDMRSLSE